MVVSLAFHRAQLLQNGAFVVRIGAWADAAPLRQREVVAMAGPSAYYPLWVRGIAAEPRLRVCLCESGPGCHSPIGQRGRYGQETIDRAFHSAAARRDRWAPFPHG